MWICKTMEFYYIQFYRGWEQLEVTCNPNIKDKKTLWSVEEVTDQRCKICKNKQYICSTVSFYFYIMKYIKTNF